MSTGNGRVMPEDVIVFVMTCTHSLIYLLTCPPLLKRGEQSSVLFALTGPPQDLLLQNKLAMVSQRLIIPQLLVLFRNISIVLPPQAPYFTYIVLLKESKIHSVKNNHDE